MPNVINGPEPTLTLLRAIAAGLSKLPPTVTSVSILNETYTIAQLGTQLATLIAPYAAAEAAELARGTAIEARAAVEASTTEFVGASVVAFKAALGRTSTNLSILGIEPDKIPEPLTVPQKVTRSARAAATRKARGTKGKKQTAAIHGAAPATPPADAPAAATPPAATPPTTPAASG